MARYLTGLAAMLGSLFSVAALWAMLPARPITSWQTENSRKDSCLYSPEMLISANGEVLAAIGDARITLWEIATKKELARISPAGRRKIHRTNLAPDGRSVFYEELLREDEKDEKALKLWRMGQGDPITIGNGDTYVGEFSGDGKIALLYQRITGCRREAKVWDLATGQERPSPGWDSGAILTAKRLPDGSLLAFENAGDGLRVWDVAAQRIRLTIPDAGNPGSIVICNNGKLLATKGRHGTRLWDMHGGREVDLLKGEAGGLQGHGSRLHTCTDKEVILWDVSQAPARKIFSYPWRTPSSSRFSPDGRWVEISRTEERTNQIVGKELWNASTGEKITFNEFEIASVGEFAPDSRTWAGMANSFGSEERLQKWIWQWALWWKPTIHHAVKVWDPATGQVLATFDCDKFAYLPDGKSMAVLTSDGTIQIWDISPRRPMWVEYGLPVLSVLILAFSLWYSWRSWRSRSR